MRDDTEDSDLDLDIDLDGEEFSDDDLAGVEPGGGATGGAEQAKARQRAEADRPASAAAESSIPPRRARPLQALARWPQALGAWLRRHTPLAPSRCVVLGPSASGKTALLMSLVQCETEQSHSFLQYSASLVNKNADFQEYLRDLNLYLPSGLDMQGTDLGNCRQPEFTLCLGKREEEAGQHDRPHWVRGWLARLRRRDIRMRFSTFDGAGGLVVSDPLAATSGLDTRDLRGRVRCRDLLYQSLRGCDAVLICLPIDPAAGGYYREQEIALKDVVHRLAEDPNVRDLVLCFTMYEKLGAAEGRMAYRELTKRTFAKAAMRRALEQSKRIRQAIRQFRQSEPRRRVWCVPVSSFGFVPGNGGANLAEVVRSDGTRGDVLRTRYSEAGDSDSERPYTERQVWDELWQPFATLDPFIFIATGFKEHHNTLIHSYRELWR